MYLYHVLLSTDSRLLTSKCLLQHSRKGLQCYQRLGLQQVASADFRASAVM